jgi:hypothetical protein
MKNSIQKLHEAVSGLNLGYKGSVSTTFYPDLTYINIIIMNDKRKAIYSAIEYVDSSDFNQSEQVLEKEVNKAITFINSIND